MEVSDGAVRILAAMLESRSGQQLSDGRRWRIDTALRPLMRERGFESLDALVTHMVGGSEPRFAETVVEALLNHETFFYRDTGPFQLLQERGLPRLQATRRDQRRLRIWCAGCATGQEAYTLAMILSDHSHGWRDWRIEILATDLSNAAIARAREGVYSQIEIQRGLPVRQMLRYFRHEGDQWRATPALRSMIRFKAHNLCEPPPAGRFDLILCRNVLLYFSGEMRRLVLGRIASAIAPDGVLMLGAGETVIGNSDAFVSDYEARGLYRPRVDLPQAKAG
jgi:chemotaxis protein methyltransferase CheR